ncbi:2-oxoglutarate dehydrogenase, E2 component, dihydrolipoamide succinyltransferase [Corynebacterium sp. zg254]|uniref:Dihydrolipoamide acetyltransferase component of pyruvate dehydrogenase complex n=1 Tax=Corynebacterium zhongnanshanii TaxID=2768834 RepID=A0ABQ6VD54_9CORY|nr:MULTISPECIES: 2-oxoglutarate dehydrogenase, E2 component, dihydrolipoamide succinyltransferase [Corynebacterium]KAB3520852.1 2-oxoglutarate dehydrogenase, E2 component, dihydrolipoamide succinyltransferase [Corynebacterium zhongnanshanii]MCR5914475.1 2-oxoglutarate dehydrogenase, E2 component, dihydrolipoamide succinyltransferase [Corynebacterium sp. zg254]
MAHNVEMPELGESVTEGTITQWLKKVGDTVEVDEPLLEVSTDKVDTEIPSPVAGVLLEIKADEDETIDVGDVIAVIGDEDEASDSSDDADDADADDADGADEADDQDDAADDADDEDADDADESSDDEDDEDDEADDEDAAAESGDAEDVTMPELGESVTEGTITQWLKKVGDSVEVDEPLLEVSTDKVDTEIPSPVAGTLVEIVADEDDTVDVGDVIARIGDGSAPKKSSKKSKDSEKSEKSDDKDEKKSEKSEDTKADESKEDKKAEKSEDKDEKKSAGEPSEDNLPYVTPLVRKLAEKHSVDLSTVSGTGVGGRIRKQDVLAAADKTSEDTTSGSDESGSATSETSQSSGNAGSRASTHKVDPRKEELRGSTQRINRVREVTASKTLESLHSSAQLTQVHEVDVTGITNLIAAHEEAYADKHGAELTVVPFFAKAIVEALVSHPNINASYNAETKEVTYHESVNLSVTVDTEEGQLSPVIADAQKLSLPELAQAIVDVADRARNSQLKPNDLADGTFTLTDIGSEGALTDTPILTPPQAALVATGRIVRRPVIMEEDGSEAIAIRSMVFLPITYDHRIIDSADAGRFLSTVRDRLEKADFEADLEL